LGQDCTTVKIAARPFYRNNGKHSILIRSALRQERGAAATQD
jgi:hypothetical protein